MFHHFLHPHTAVNSVSFCPSNQSEPWKPYLQNRYYDTYECLVIIVLFTILSRVPVLCKPDFSINDGAITSISDRSLGECEG